MLIKTRRTAWPIKTPPGQCGLSGCKLGMEVEQQHFEMCVVIVVVVGS